MTGKPQGTKSSARPASEYQTRRTAALERRPCDGRPRSRTVISRCGLERDNFPLGRSSVQDRQTAFGEQSISSSERVLDAHALGCLLPDVIGEAETTDKTVEIVGLGLGLLDGGIGLLDQRGVVLSHFLERAEGAANG